MNREEFTAFVAGTIEDLIQLAEAKCGEKLSRKIAFRWLGGSHPVVTEHIIEHIVDRVFVDEELSSRASTSECATSSKTECPSSSALLLVTHPGHSAKTGRVGRGRSSALLEHPS